jgi:hypothetical protein
MPWVDSLDWTDQNSLRRYPLREGSSALSIDENFSIPDTLIVDFSLSATSEVTARFYISKIFNKLTSLTIEVSDAAGILTGIFEIDNYQHRLNKDYYMQPADSYVGANGKITIGGLSDLARQPAGEFYFNLTASEFEPRTIIPGLQGIDRISLIDSLNGSKSLTGSVTLTSRLNLNFTYESNKVLLDVGDGLGLNKPCITGNCVKSINGVLPDPVTGDISLLGINCLRVYSSAEHTLDFEDTCCTPCSGCNDLEELTTRLTSLENKFLELKTSYNSVNSQLTNYLTTINSNCACPG